jgi:hypothetical protein
MDKIKLLQHPKDNLPATGSSLFLGLTKTLTVLRQTGWQQFDKNLCMIHIWCKFTSK